MYAYKMLLLAKKLVNCVQTPLGNYQASYTDDQCFCFDEVVKIRFHIKIALVKAFKTESQYNRAGELQQISTRQLPLAMSPELCLSATEMALRIIQGEKKIQKSLEKSSW